MVKVQKGRRYVVHPTLTTDPYNMRGEMVEVTRVKNDVAYVKNVRTGKKGMYMTDTLMGIREYEDEYTSTPEPNVCMSDQQIWEERHGHYYDDNY
jgi:hypothetical protein